MHSDRPADPALIVHFATDSEDESDGEAGGAGSSESARQPPALATEGVVSSGRLVSKVPFTLY